MEDADTMGNLTEQRDEDDYEYKEIADDGKEVEDGDAMGDLIEEQKDADELGSECKRTCQTEWTDPSEDSGSEYRRCEHRS